jgi:hypothetical protein
MMRLFLCLFLAIVAIRPSPGADRVSEASSGKAPAKGDLVLFPFDDDTIPWRFNLKLELQRPKRYPGGPVMKPLSAEGPDGFGNLLYGTVLKEGAKYRMWYVAGPRIDSRIPGDAKRMVNYRPIAYAESTDGIHWERPDLGLVEFRGNKHNNLVAIQPAGEPYAHSFDFIAVFYEPEDPNPARRYKIAFIAYDFPLKECSTATAVSADGLTWTLQNTRMFTRGHFENTGLIKFNGLYYLSGQNVAPWNGELADGSAAGRVMKVFFSPDFHHWSEERALAFYRNAYEPKPMSQGQEVHMGAGLWHRGTVILGFYGRWYGNTIRHDDASPHAPLTGLKMDLGFVVSNDAIHYREPLRDFVMLPHGEPGDWDSESVLQANAFANTDTETYIWYSHWNTSQSDVNSGGPNTIRPLPEKLSDTMLHKGEYVGLLRLPRDRFGYFTKLASSSTRRNPQYSAPVDASFLTRSLRLDRASDLYVNVDDVSAGSPLEIALVDDAERPLSGYTAKSTTPSLKAPVAWQGHKTLPANTSFRVKVVWPVGVDNPKLYAVYIEAR